MHLGKLGFTQIDAENAQTLQDYASRRVNLTRIKNLRCSILTLQRFHPP